MQQLLHSRVSEWLFLAAANTYQRGISNIDFQESPF